MGVETVAEELIRASAIACSHGLRSAEEGPAGEADPNGYKGFFLEPTGELLPPVFLVEIPDRRFSRLRGM